MVVTELCTSSMAVSDTVHLQPKFASVSGSTSGNNTLVAAVTAKKVRVVAGVFVGAGAVTLALQTGASGTGITGVMSLVTGTPLVWPFNPLGYCETASGALLNMSLGGAVQVSGCLVYVEV